MSVQVDAHTKDAGVDQDSIAQRFDHYEAFDIEEDEDMVTTIQVETAMHAYVTKHNLHQNKRSYKEK